MAIAKYWQRGEKIDFLNSTSSTIKNGEVVTLGERIGIAGDDILAGQIGTVVLTGVFKIAKDSSNIKIGNALYFSNDKVTSTKTGIVVAGMAVADAGTDATEALVRLV